MLQPPGVPGAQAYPISDQSDKSTDPITSTLVSSKSSLSAAGSFDSDSSSDASDSDSDSDSDDTTDSETTDRLRDLFLKAKASAREKAAAALADSAQGGKGKGKVLLPAQTEDSLAGQDEVVFFGGEGSDDDEVGAEDGDGRCDFPVRDDAPRERERERERAAD